MSITEEPDEGLPANALRRLVASGGIRLLVLPISGIAVLLTTKLVTSEFGAEQYALLSIVIALPFLIPVTDLGLGAAATNAAALLPDSADVYRRTIRATRLILIKFSSVLILATVCAAALGLWTKLLSLPHSSANNVAIACALTIFFLSIPASLGPRILVGLRRNGVATAIQGSISLTNLFVAYAFITAGASFTYVLGSSLIGVLVSNLLCGLVAWSDPRVRWTRVSATRYQRLNREPLEIWKTALPMLLISAALPLTFQTDRVVLSWFGGLHDVATYSAAAMLYLPALSVVQTATRSLWGDFAKIRNSPESLRSIYLRSVLVSSALGLIGATLLVGLGPIVSRWATNGEVSVHYVVFAAFAILLVVHAMHSPGAMFLTDIQGLRFQVVTTLCMGICTLPLSIVAANYVGPSGPIFATTVGLSCCQLIPCMIRILRKTNTGSHSKGVTT